MTACAIAPTNFQELSFSENLFKPKETLRDGGVNAAITVVVVLLIEESGGDANPEQEVQETSPAPQLKVAKNDEKCTEISIADDLEKSISTQSYATNLAPTIVVILLIEESGADL